MAMAPAEPPHAEVAGALVELRAALSERDARIDALRDSLERKSEEQARHAAQHAALVQQVAALREAAARKVGVPQQRGSGATPAAAEHRLRSPRESPAPLPPAPPAPPSVLHAAPHRELVPSHAHLARAALRQLDEALSRGHEGLARRVADAEEWGRCALARLRPEQVQQCGSRDEGGPSGGGAAAGGKWG